MSVLRRVPVAGPVLLALSPLAAGIALAQEQLEEIVVTARMRAESSIEAPAAIKAFTAAEIDSLRHRAEQRPEGLDREWVRQS